MVVGRGANLLRVLLVEDNPGDARLVTMALAASGNPRFAVTHVVRLADALAHLRGDTPVDVVLLDLTLPDSSGIATLSRLQEAAPNLAIVVMTGLDDPAFADYALEVGAQDYLVKSDDPERTVVRAIRYAITRMNAQLERQALMDRLSAQQQRLMQELSAARAMQFDLLPRPELTNGALAALGMSVEAYFEPSSGIGGDLWGCLEAGPDCMSFYAFDFSGHGIGAALNVFRLHALIRDHWVPGRGPAETLADLGSALSGLLGTGQFATMILCTLDCRRDELVWAAAGAPAPLAMVDGGMEFLDTTGLPLGLSKNPHYDNHSMPFPRGSTLFIYSDAVVEATDDADQLLGEEALAEMVAATIAADGRFSVDGLLDRLFARVRLPIEDDLTAVSISRL
ncbi:MAG TPA: SpoIIE family protein phosphatase [Candidatus Omnitrophota bacterium]|nr:SpoIIE family protein phosphatase [Candidatus Omnitrophota bacterium]